MHRKLERVAREAARRCSTNPDDRTIDWAAAEELAFASILADGVEHPADRRGRRAWHVQPPPCRVSRRRRAASVHVPLQSLPQATRGVRDPQQPADRERGRRVRVRLQHPGAVAAGDLGSAVPATSSTARRSMIDEFIVSARGKWGQRRRSCLLLPHAHEGQGPDHASARPERFLQLAADINMRVANCTTAAQYFHLLRRQAALLLVDPLPLIVLTPKSLLRHRVRGIGAARARRRAVPASVIPTTTRRRCARRRHPPRAVLHRQDLRRSDRRRAPRSAARRGHLPGRAALSAADARPARHDRGVSRTLEEVVWVQEEPENMGAWEFVRPLLQEVAGGRTVSRVARPRSASPAEGSAARHASTSRR